MGHGPFGFDFERGEVSALGLGAVLQAFLLGERADGASARHQRRAAPPAAATHQQQREADQRDPRHDGRDDPGDRPVRRGGAGQRRHDRPDRVRRGRAGRQEIWDLPFAPPGVDRLPGRPAGGARAQVSRETDVVTSSGDKRRVMWNTGYVRDERDRPTYVVITGTDLTAERTAAGLTRHLLEAAVTTAMIGIDPRGRITVFNAGAVNLLGYDGQDMVGTPFVDLLDPDQVAQRCHGRDRRRGVPAPRRRHRERRRDRTAGLDLDRQRRAAPHGVDDAERRGRHVRGPDRLPLRRPRRHRGARQPGDADRRPGEGAARRRSG